MQQLELPQGALALARYPERHDPSLRAWDAADEYLLRHVDEQGLDPAACIAILNDGFGALSVALAGHRPEVFSDSYLAHLAIRANLQRNGWTEEAIRLRSSLASPQQPLDWLLIKVPKTLALLEDQLHRLRPYLQPSTQVVAAGMVKGIPRSTLALFQRLVGPTHTSLARKKARLIFSQFDASLRPGPSPYPDSYRLEGQGMELSNHANLFSRQGLDRGTRLLLAHLPEHPDAGELIDLGCGNGVIGIHAAQRHPQAQLHFIDESFMAVASAEENFRRQIGSEVAARFEVNDGLSGVADGGVDLVLNNPPFHQQRAMGDFIAWEMFVGARRVLRPGGELWVVANRHLGYHAKLKRIFGNSVTVSSDGKFVLLQARKR